MLLCYVGIKSGVYPLNELETMQEPVLDWTEQK